MSDVGVPSLLPELWSACERLPLSEGFLQLGGTVGLLGQRSGQGAVTDF